MTIKIMTIVGTRPEIIKLSRVIAELDKYTRHVLVHTGQSYDYELNEVFFKDLGIRPADHYLNAAGDTAAQTIGQVIAKADEVMAQEQPDALLILGDTNSCLAAISAKRRQIPIFHMEAGNRCFDQRVPEEINRKIVDHISDINLTYSEHARRYLMAEGLRPETIIKTGSPMREVLEFHRDHIEQSTILAELRLQPGEYFVASAHREENLEKPAHLAKIMHLLRAVGEKYRRPVIVSTHPRLQKKRPGMAGSGPGDYLTFLKPLGFFDYIKLQQHAFCVISDSGTITEEASILNLPAVTIRQTHERPEGMDAGTLIMCGLEADRVLQCIDIVTAQQGTGERVFNLVPDYDTANVSQKVLRIILSYTDYVNRTVWHK